VSHLKGSVVKLGSELSAKFKVFGMIRPGAGAEKIVNSFAEDLQNLHLHDIVVLNAGANLDLDLDLFSLHESLHMM
jgi:hypothetical protein